MFCGKNMSMSELKHWLFLHVPTSNEYFFSIKWAERWRKCQKAKKKNNNDSACSTKDKPIVNTLKLCTLKKADLIFFFPPWKQWKEVTTGSKYIPVLALLLSQRFAITMNSSMKVLSKGEKVKRLKREK